MQHIIQFSKYHGLGNDFILIDGLNQRLSDIAFSELAPRICERRFGIGADGLIVCLPSEQSDAKMVIYNSDGTEPEICGNGIRCFARFLFEKKLVEKDVFSIETAERVVIPAIIMKEGVVAAVEVDMGQPDISAHHFLTETIDSTAFIKFPIQIDADTVLETSIISMGNPHAVVFVDDAQAVSVAELGSRIENHPIFSHKTNVEFAQVLSRNEVIVKVWERGAGETLACGSGACATVAAGVLNNHLDRNVAVHLPGGKLLVDWQEPEDKMIMTGPASHIYDGSFQV